MTGGAGFIGSTLTGLLLERGHDVRIYDDLSSGAERNLDEFDVELVVGDVLDLESLTAAARGCDALSSGRRGQDCPVDLRAARQLRPERPGTVCALEAARLAEVPRVVFSSSNAPLGAGAYPASEEKPVAPLSPYGASKAVGEAYCSAYHGAYGLDAVTVRFSNAYGPRSAHKGNVIPVFIRRILAGEEFLVVYGDGSADARLRAS